MGDMDLKSETATNQNENSNTNPNGLAGNGGEEGGPQQRTYIMKRARKWELKPVKVANVWDFNDDVTLYKWVRGTQSNLQSNV